MSTPMTLTWADGFTRYSCIVTDSTLTEYRENIEIGHADLTRTPELDGNPAADDHRMDADGRYANDGDTVWIDGRAYAVTWIRSNLGDA